MPADADNPQGGVFESQQQLTREEFKELLAEGLQSINKRLDKLEGEVSSRLDNLAMDLKIVQEREKRFFGEGRYKDRPGRPETETQGAGHSSHIWERKPATPRVS